MNREAFCVAHLVFRAKLVKHGLEEVSEKEQVSKAVWQEMHVHAALSEYWSYEFIMSLLLILLEKIQEACLYFYSHWRLIKCIIIMSTMSSF